MDENWVLSTDELLPVFWFRWINPITWADYKPKLATADVPPSFMLLKKRKERGGCYGRKTSNERRTNGKG